MLIKRIILISLSLIMFFSGLIFLVGGSDTNNGVISNGPPLAHAEEHVHQKYTCSMHPFVIKDEPGACPICAMDLVPVKMEAVPFGDADQDSGNDLRAGPVITIDPVTRQNMGVRTERINRRDMHRTIRTVGLVGYEEAKQYSVNSKVDGWIENLFVNETGGQVKKGQALLEIYSPQLVAAQEEFLLALRNKSALENSTVPAVASGALRLLESSRKRLKYWDISEKQIAELEQSGTASKTLILHAPYDGIVTAKMVTEGMYVKTGLELFKIADISRVWVYADIYEYELPWIEVGQVANIQLPYHSTPLKGTISTIYPYVEPKTRTVKARIDLENANFDLKPDMYVNVRIDAQSVNNVLSIPVEAVLNSGDKKTVFVDLGAGKFEPRLIKIGLSGEDGYVQVAEGLREGEMVVTSAQFMLDSESTLRAAIQKMLEPVSHEQTVSEKKQESADDLF